MFLDNFQFTILTLARHTKIDLLTFLNVLFYIY